MFSLFFILLILIGLALPLFAIIDILRNEFKGDNKIIWILIVLLFPYLGSILYFFIGSNNKV